MTQKEKTHSLLTPDVLRLFDIFDDRLRLVGGAVRDYLMARPIHDIDLATPFKPAEVLKKLHQHHIETYETGAAHGTITAVLNQTPYEITTLRTDMQTDGRHALVSFIDDYAADALRRDLTINALYMDREGTVFDYTNGLTDIQKAKIRFIGTPAKRVQEDYLRILRFFRFYAFYGKGKPDKASLEACRFYKNGLNGVSFERKREELLRLLTAPFPLKALVLMHKIGLFETLGLSVDLEAFAVFNKQMPDANALQRLAILAGASDLKPFRFSKIQEKALAIYQENPDFSDLKKDRFLLRYFGRDAFLFHLNKYRLTHHISGQTAQKIKKLKMPIFPITPQDIMDLGYTGAQIGQQLRYAEQVWQNLNFCPKKKLVLKQLLIYNQDKD